MEILWRLEAFSPPHPGKPNSDGRFASENVFGVSYHSIRFDSVQPPAHICVN